MRNMNVGHLTDTALSLKERVMSYEIDLDPYLSCFQSDCYQIFSDCRMHTNTSIGPNGYHLPCI